MTSTMTGNYRSTFKSKFMESTKENSMLNTQEIDSDPIRFQNNKTASRYQNISRGTFYNYSINSKSPKRGAQNQEPPRTALKYNNISSKFTRTSNGERFLKVK